MVFVWQVLRYYHLLAVLVLADALQNALSDCIELLNAQNRGQI